MSTTNTTRQAPRQIYIRPYPFNTALANDLISPLDEEMAALYPEFDNPLKPGTDVAFDEADPDYRPNPVPVLSLSSEDAVGDNGDDVVNDKDKDADGLHLFVAFDVTDLDEASAAGISSTASNVNGKAYVGTPVGCVALKTLPYYPDHRRRPHQPPYTPDSPPPTVAEIKRVYVVPSHRGVPVVIHPSSSPVISGPTTTTTTTMTTSGTAKLAASLLSTAAVYARDVLHLEKLVLEVGFRQVAAMRVYERLGWSRIGEFGDYVGFGVDEGGVSLCYGLVL